MMEQYKNILKEKLKKVTEDKTKTAQDPDIKDKDGTQPKKYYAGDMSKTTKEKRAAHFKNKKSGPAPGDASAKTKPSKHTKKYHAMYGEKLDPNKDDLGDYIDDFMKSDAPQFQGKSSEKIKKMAIAAYLSAKEKNEEYDTDLGEDSISDIKAWFSYHKDRKKYEQAVRLFLNLRRKNPGKASANLRKVAQMTGGNIRIIDKVLRDMVKSGALPKHLVNYPTLQKEDTLIEDHESRMALTQLRALADKSDQIAEEITKKLRMENSDDVEIEAWVQSKITKASDYINSVYDYMLYSEDNE